ncbi:unnamed protein product [Clonostachys rosea]|uniref:Ubiquitin-like protease family profile domain-containing protein n=1 Tax=Bionectria ochroleuca TaxID=29856 RepID=A0ABY6UKY7_BIOOC|nr:unnamed protein product [Clonostachys rosea]
MRNKRRVMLALYHRGRLSLGDNRIRLGYRSYHWGIIISPKNARPGHPVCNSYDATDAFVIDPITGQDLNPNLDWFFRAQHDINPSATGQLIGRIIVGKLPNDVTDSEIDALLATVPLPVQDASPSESCVTWALVALSTLQASGFAWSFDIKEFQDWALAYGDQCMKNIGADSVCEYLREGNPTSKP